MPDIVITPNRGTTNNPKIDFTGVTAGTIKLEVLADGTIAWNGANGSLFSISDSLSGSLMSVNDVSGLPAFEVFSDNRVVVGQFGARLGIGVTSPSYKLDVAGAANTIAAKIGAASQYLTIGSYTPNSAGATLGYNTTQYLGLNAFFGVLVGRTYVSNNSTAPADGMAIQGNLGVGTVSPGGKLELNFTAATGATALILRTSDSSGNGAIRWQNNAGTNQAGIGSNFNVSDVGAIEFINGATTNVIFRSSGNVGIGTTSPSQKLDVSSTTAGAQNIAITKLNSGTGNENSGNLYFDNYGPANLARNSGTELGSIYFRSSQPSSAAIQNSARIQAIADGTQTGLNTQGAVTFAVVPSGSTLVEAMRISSAGNVGIGVSNPLTNLQIGKATVTFPTLGTASGNLSLTNNSTALWGMYVGLDGSGSGWIQQMRNDSAIAYNLALNPLGGNVGIGTTSPYSKLTVAGDINLGNNPSGLPYLEQGDYAIRWGYEAGDGYNIKTDYKAYTNAAGTANTYSRLQLNWHTGIEIGAHSLYGGTRFFTNAPGLGASQIMSIGDSDNNVRIASSTSSTSASSGALQVTGGIGAGGPSYFGGTVTLPDNIKIILGSYLGETSIVRNTPDDRLDFKVGGNTNLVIQRGGNVGIGTTASDLNGITQKLTIGMSGTTGSGIGIYSLQNVAQQYIPIGVQYSSGNTNNGAQIRFGIDAAGDTRSMIAFAVANGSTPVEQVRITCTGDVGIGTTTPNAKLNIAGASGGGLILLSLTPSDSTSASNKIVWSRSDNWTPASIGQVYSSGTNYGGNLVFSTHADDGAVGSQSSPIERMRILASGNVGIGTTNAAQALSLGDAKNLSFQNTLGGTGTYGAIYSYNALVNITTPATAIRFLRDVASIGPDGAIALDTNNTERFRITSTGSVGIGTTSPGALLHTVNTVDVAGPIFENTGGRGSITVKASSTNSTYVQFGNANGNSRAFVDFRESDGYLTLATSFSAGYITFNTGSQVERVRILSTGNVGIGTTTPGSKLSVAQDMTIGADLVDSTAQMVIQGVTTPGKKLMLGYDTNGNGFGFIKAGNLGVAWTNLALQPNAGSVSIGTTSATYKLDVNGIAYAATDFRAPIFYDSNNTAYYTDPASTSNFNRLNLVGFDSSGRNYSREWIEFSNYTGLYSPNNAAHFHPNDNSGYTPWTVRGARGGWYGLHFLDAGNIPHLMFSNANGGIYFQTTNRWASYYNHGDNCWGFGASTTNSAYNIYCPTGVYSGGRVDGTIFYDSNNTVYYVDPASTSNLNAATFAGTVATGALTVTGAITATGNVTAYYSDDRLKTRLGPITDPLGKLKSLSGFYFEPNQAAQDLGYERKTDVGVSAQEVQAILPEIIAPAPIDAQYLTVRYEKLIPLLIEAVKAQQVQIEELKAQIIIIQQTSKQ